MTKQTFTGFAIKATRKYPPKVRKDMLKAKSYLQMASAKLAEFFDMYAEGVDAEAQFGHASGRVAEAQNILAGVMVLTKGTPLHDDILSMHSRWNVLRNAMRDAEAWSRSNYPGRSADQSDWKRYNSRNKMVAKKLYAATNGFIRQI